MSTSTTPAPKVIKAKLGLGHQAAQDVLNASLNVYNNFFASSFFSAASGAPAYPVDQATLKAANDTLQSAIAAAAGGSKQAITAKNHAKDAVIALLDQLATYVSVNSKGDMNAFISSGFTPKSTAKTKTAPVSETIKKIVPASLTGQMLVFLMKFPGAKTYLLQWGVPGPGGALPTTWSSMPVDNLKNPATVTGLTPGTTYVFQARAVIQNGYSNWGDPVARIAV
jgi:Fibronectin type III domain